MPLWNLLFLFLLLVPLNLDTEMKILVLGALFLIVSFIFTHIYIDFSLILRRLQTIIRLSYVIKIQSFNNLLFFNQSNIFIDLRVWVSYKTDTHTLSFKRFFKWKLNEKDAISIRYYWKRRDLLKQDVQRSLTTFYGCIH